MNKTRTILAVAYLLACVLGSVAFAQGGPGNRGRAGGRMYDTKTIETITGEVLAVNLIASGRGRAGGVHLTVKTDKEEIAVHLGPQWYVDQQAMKLAAKDRVEVRGSRVTFEGKPVIIAAEVKKGDQVLKLRDEGGLPLWSGRGR
ncbi:MAG: hypothetical protein A2Y95_02925 [Deltaproteobacteria bacterium RBG_13_65_10]|jgi:hypothetical protein|nr:MAG: hypothetical protein A2Y95_02925 [Deltaproteobacteria bacterium RBG_13_65_10]